MSSSVTGIVDGTTTTLKCGIHEFETTDPTKFEDHMMTGEGHYLHGHAQCVVCGKQYDFTSDEKSVQYKHVALGRVMHPGCKEEFMK